MDDRHFRNAMGKFATGVTVITTEENGQVHGMTANGFMSISLNPKLIAISIGENAQMLKKIKKNRKFAVNILAESQDELSKIFAGQIKDEKDVEFKLLQGVPVLDGSIAQVVCEVKNIHVEGDHTLFIGSVIDIHVEDNDPLLFFSGKYRSLLATETVVI